MLRSPGMPALIGMSVLGFTSFFLTLSSLPVWAVDQGVPEALAGLVTTVMLFATVACQLLVPTAVRRIGQPATLAIGLLALGAPTPLLLLSDQLWWLLTVSAVRGLGFAVLTVLTPLIATQIAPPGSHGRAIGLYGLADSGTVVTWALLLLGVTSALARWRAGGLADRAGPARLLPLCAGIGVLGLVLLGWGAAGTGVGPGIMVVLGSAVFGIAYGGAQNLTLLLSFDLAGPGRRAGASAAWNATYDAGTAIGALLIGAVAAGSSLTVAMAGCAALVVVTAVPAVVSARPPR